MPLPYWPLGMLDMAGKVLKKLLKSRLLLQFGKWATCHQDNLAKECDGRQWIQQVTEVIRNTAHSLRYPGVSRL